MKILITGDSWAAGDWNLTNGTVSHFVFSPVLDHLLEEAGHTVIHFPHPGQSDLPSLLKIKENINYVDFVIFFKTDIFRLFCKKNKLFGELDKKEYNLIKGSQWPNFEDYLNLTKKELGLSDEIIKEMNSHGLYFIFSNFLNCYSSSKNLDLSLMMLEDEIIYKDLFNVKDKIMLIGGRDNIKTKFKFPYQVNSLANFLINCQDTHYNTSESEVRAFVTLIKKSKLKNNLSDILPQLEKHIDKTINRFKDQKNNKKYFFSDDGHPNTNAIKLYYHELIKPILKEI